MDKHLLDVAPLTDSSNRFGNLSSNLLYPESEDEVVDIVTKANESGKKLSIVSGGTKLGYGGLKSNYDLTLSLKKFSGIVEHTVGDMTVTVKPGTTILELQTFLSRYNQMVSLDPSCPSTATIGGTIAANESGPKRLKYGSARDHVIGMRVVYADGKIIRTGGKVVKNVAGYDMNKLFIGSMGTLGVITEITLKLRPIPKHTSLVMLTVREEALDELTAFTKLIQDSLLEPVSLEILTPTMSKKLINRDEYCLLIALEDVKKAVQFQEVWIDQHKPNEAVMTVHPNPNYFWQSFNELIPNSLTDLGESTHGVLKVGTRNLDVFPLLQECARIHHEGNLKIEASGGAGHGLSTIIISGNNANVVNAIIHLQSFASDLKGYAIVKHLPIELRKELNVWGESDGLFKLFKSIKQKQDPNNTLNEQRFIGGI
ncbi:FAD-binding oxidoreductase [Pseudalkalibacillus hwajinpoensis]|uniref:FAD-binding oxidoreductase n=1 Tax=Guptibacillus hwajinpoensis TaxID=208199 RepID=A0A4U1MIZ0_9BACL|nr:FAD-binding oxidoreductase [Pseudalkalibacillus hwajinpoensis]TKD71349.1 FAD-binding oxidoreductase [Pseudalkalibacillus hwajinpoensis]